MIKLEKGAKVKVRLHTGEVVEAVYDQPAAFGSYHWVKHNGKHLQTVGCSHRLNRSTVCRLVGNPCVLLPAGVSV